MSPAQHAKPWSKDDVARLKKLYARKVVHRDTPASAEGATIVRCSLCEQRIIDAPSTAGADVAQQLKRTVVDPAVSRGVIAVESKAHEIGITGKS